MLKFRKLCAEDFSSAAPIMYKEPFMTSEGSFVALYFWSGVSGCKICFDGETVFLKIPRAEGDAYLFPYGGDLKAALEKIYEEERAKGNSCVCFVGITKKMRDMLEKLFPGEFSYKENRASFDYIYKAQALASLSGKALHQKRNHVNKFMKKYEGRYEYEPMTEGHLREVYAFQKKWMSFILEKEKSEMLEYECGAIEGLLKHFSDFSLLGGVLRVDGEICAYCLGSRMSENTVDVMVEKADYSFAGAYQMINKCFANQVEDTVVYINREDDMGIAGLRKSKLSYCPELLCEKYNVIWKR